ncbi:hypothetical protein H106_03156 [Trichophyton rubrum CBS 735.88]|nr:hypothetical protein H106_03156 [Trichophyton rubrum CBS 735.88]
MSSIRLPYLLPDGTVDWGFYCDACMNTTTYPYLTPESEFLKHARVCEWIRDYVESNCGVPDPNIEKHDHIKVLLNNTLRRRAFYTFDIITDGQENRLPTARYFFETAKYTRGRAFKLLKELLRKIRLYDSKKSGEDN